MFVLWWCGVCCEWVIELGTAHRGESLPRCVCIGKCEQAVWVSGVFQGGERFRRESLVFVGVVVGALMTARRARLLDRMNLFWRAFASVVQYAFLPYCRSDWMTDMVLWCIRLTRLTLICEVIWYRLVQVWQNVKKKKNFSSWWWWYLFKGFPNRD